MASLAYVSLLSSQFLVASKLLPCVFSLLLHIVHYLNQLVMHLLLPFHQYYPPASPRVPGGEECSSRSTDELRDTTSQDVPSLETRP